MIQAALMKNSNCFSFFLSHLLRSLSIFIFLSLSFSSISPFQSLFIFLTSRCRLHQSPHPWLSVPRENEKMGKRKKKKEENEKKRKEKKKKRKEKKEEKKRKRREKEKKRKRKSFLMRARELKGALHEKARNYVSYSADRKLKERENRKPKTENLKYNRNLSFQLSCFVCKQSFSYIINCSTPIHQEFTKSMLFDSFMLLGNFSNVTGFSCMIVE
jgi:hypothetical protein